MRLGYLVSLYPAVSHTFIRREVEALRDRGAEIHTFSVRKAGREDAISEEDRREAAGTCSILPISPIRLASAHLRALAVRPRAYLMTLVLALQCCPRGARAALWAIFHFIEAVVLAQELRTRNIGHLHTHFANSGGTVGMLATRFLGIGWSLTLHGTADFENLATLGAKIKAAHFTACASHFGRAQALRTCDPEIWDRVFVSRCGIDTAHIQPRGRSPDNSPPRLVSVGRLSSEKGHSGLLLAFRELRNRGVEAQLRIIGDGPERARLGALAERLGLGDRCEFLGAQPVSRVLVELAEADLFAMSSLMEGIPVVLMEAMALGVPVVAPRLGGIPELVEDGRTGLLFHPADWSDLTSRLAKLLEDRAMRESLGKRGRERVVEHFDLASAVEPLLARFKSVCSESAGPLSPPS